MDWTGCTEVEIIPGKVSGITVLRGSRVPAEAIERGYDLGQSAEELSYDYDLSLEQVRALLRFVTNHQRSVPAR